MESDTNRPAYPFTSTNEAKAVARMSTTVSVVIPTYNRKKDIVRAVQSALAQTHPPFEVLVIDDGSTDATADVVRAMPAPVRYIGKPNGGVSSARNN